MHLAIVKWHFIMSKMALYDPKSGTFQIANNNAEKIML